MADYYPLIARAIAGLDPSAPGESRRALYERARAALIAQLRSVQPPLSESEITRERAGAPRRGPDNSAPQAPGVRGFRDIAADADDLGRAAAQANRAARKTYANVPSPSPEFDRLEPSMEDRGADPETPYSYDESVDEAERYAQPPPRPRLAPDREPKRRGRTGAVFPFKSAIAVGIVLILVGAAILWGRSAVTAVSGLFKPQPSVEAPKDAS